MFRTYDIRRFISLVPEKKAIPFLELLGERGLVQLDNPAQFEEKGFESRGGSLSLSDLHAILENSGKLIDEFHALAGAGVVSRISRQDYSFDAKEDLNWLAMLKRKRDQHERLSGMIAGQLEIIGDEEAECRRLVSVAGDIRTVNQGRYLSLLYGAAPGELPVENLTLDRVFHVSTTERILLLCPLGGRESLRNFLEQHGFRDMTPFLQHIIQHGGSEILMERLRRRDRELRRRLEVIDRVFEDFLRQSLGRLRAMYRTAHVLAAIAREAEKIRPGEVLALFTGWIPLRDEKKFSSLLGEVCGDSFFLHVYSKKEMRPWRGNVPVLLKNTSPLRPFETLVTVMGFPASGEVDPTPLAAIAYMIMFGVMFGDVGQGMVLAVTGAVIRFVTRREKSAIADIGAIMIFCGITAAFFGILYGSVFSNEHLIKPLLFSPMHSMATLFFGAIGMGAVLISIGMLFGILNRLLEGNYLDGLFHIRGMAGLLLYLTFLYSAAGLVFNIPINSTGAMTAAFSALAMVLLRPLLFRFIPGREDPLENGVFAWVVETIVELIETASSFIGNTISFIRAGAFALSHAGLSIAIYTLGDIVGGGVAAVAVIVIGNIFIILLEGLVCSIQAMRLEYYEFFSRFYSGGGEPFIPFRIPQLKGEERSWAVSG